MKRAARAGGARGPQVETVVKVGGSLTRGDAVELRRALAPLPGLARRERTLVVPGGGPLVDPVRELSGRLRLPERPAHWMAILGMDALAHLLVETIPGAALVHSPAGAGRALDRSRLPVLAPYRWLRRADPLPHAWAVTADSIAAWVAGTLGARRLILVKRAADRVGADDYFARALPAGIRVEVVVPDGNGWRRTI